MEGTGAAMTPDSLRILLTAAAGEGEGERQYKPLGLAYIGTTLLQKYPAIKIRVVDDNYESEIGSFKPHLVGITSVSQNFHIAKKIAAHAKLKKCAVLVGGIHISMLPESLDGNMDCGVMFEGEESFVELVGLLLEGKFSGEHFKGVKGVCYRSEQGLVITQPRQLISPLDSIPMPDRDLLGVRQGEDTYMFSSRGCPYKCVFCASSRFWDKVRFNSAGHVLGEIRALVNKYRTSRIIFFDDLFIADRPRLRDLVKGLKDEGLLDKIKCTVTCRANLVDGEIVALLKQLNVDAVNMGLESGCQKMLTYLKGNVTVEQNTRAIGLLKDAGFQVAATFVIGSPMETREDMLETLEFIKKSRIDVFDFYVLTPFPGTPIWEYAKGRGLVSDDMDWSRLNIGFMKNHRDAIILSEKLTREELYGIALEFERERKRKLRKRMLRAAMAHPSRIKPFLLDKAKRTVRRVRKLAGGGGS